MELVIGAIAVAILIAWVRGTRKSATPPVINPPPPKTHAPAPKHETTARPVQAPAVSLGPPKAFEFCALDTETTGLVPKSAKHRAFEISCVRFTPVDEITWTRKRFTRFVRVNTGEMKGLKLSPMWESHVSAGGQRDALDASSVLQELEEFLGDLPLVCHNAKFDKCVIENEIRKSSLKWRVRNRWICTLMMARSSKAGTFVGYSPGRPDGMSYKLEHVAGALKIPFDPGKLHLGHYDAELAGEILLKLHHVRSTPLSLLD